MKNSHLVMDYLVHWVLNESYLCWCCSPPLLYHVANSDEKGGSLEVAQEYRNLEFDARGSRQTIQIDGPAECISGTSESGVKVHILS